MQMHDSSCATQHLCMMGNMICAAHRYVRSTSIKGRGEKRSKAATCTKYIAASCKPFPSGLLRLPAPSWGPGADNADHAKSIHPIHKNPCTLLLPRDLFGAHFKKIYFVLLRLPKSLLVVFAKILIVVVVGNDNISSCRSEVGSRGRGSGDISSLASCCLTLNPAFVPQPLSPTIIIHGSCEQSPTISET